MTTSPEVDVALYLIGDFFPQEVGGYFAVESNVSVRKGTERRSAITGEILGVYKVSTWGLSSAKFILSNEIDEHAPWLIENGTPAKRLIGMGIHAFIEVRLQSGTSCVLPEILLNFARDISASIGIVARTSNIE